MKKKARNILFVLGGISLLVGIFLILGLQQSIYNQSDLGLEGTSAELVGEDLRSATIETSGTLNQKRIFGSASEYVFEIKYPLGSGNDGSFAYQITGGDFFSGQYGDSNLLTLQDDFQSLQLGKTFPAKMTNMGMYVTTEYCTIGDEKMENIKLDIVDANVTCRLDYNPSAIYADNQFKITCRYELKTDPVCDRYEDGGMSAVPAARVKILKDNVECLDASYCSTGEECQNNVCVDVTAPEPDKPEASLISQVFSRITSWINNLFETLLSPFTQQTIIGNEVVAPGETATYQIDLSANTIDNECTDGFCQTRYANWFLIDSSENIVEEGTAEEITNTYSKSVTITAPKKIDEFLLVGYIEEINQTYNFDTLSWEETGRGVVVKEGYDLQTKLALPDQPTASGIQNILSSIADFFRTLWNSIFG